MTQRTLFVLLLIAYLLAGVFEVIDNLLGLRELNFETSAPVIVKVLKEIAILVLLVVLAWRRRGFLTFPGTMFLLLFAATLVLPTLLMPEPPSARIGYLYLVASILVLLACSEVAPRVNIDALSRGFLAPAVVAICATQILEIALAPVSLYFEDSLFGLDRRAGIAVIPTTAGCIGALATFQLRGLTRWIGLVIVVLANSTIGWACMLMLLLTRSRNWRRAMLFGPVAGAALVAVAVSRSGFEESVGNRIGLIEQSSQQLLLLLPSRVGALATAKSVAIDPAGSFIADSTMLQFVHVFGIFPGVLLFAAIALLVWRACGARGLLFFIVASSGFLVIESWTVTALMIFVLARRTTPPATDSVCLRAAQRPSPRTADRVTNAAPAGDVALAVVGPDRADQT
jgi:hypothetical protein